MARLGFKLKMLLLIESRWRPLMVLGLALVLTAGSSYANSVEEAAEAARELEQSRSEQEFSDNPLIGKRPIFYSESKLRSVIEMTNYELRQLKRDFMKQMTDIYLRLKLNPIVGYEIARDQSTWAASANILMTQEFSSIAIKKHIIQRRLLTGLKLAFIKFLPMQTLVNLFRRYRSQFDWLKDQEQVELRPKFPEARENHFVILYTLIELRARVRAADDVAALTKNNLRRVLQTVQWYLVEGKQYDEVDVDELGALASNAKTLLQYYFDEVIQWRQKLHESHDTFLRNARPLAKQIGGQANLLAFIDRLIDIEALDIDVNGKAQNLAFPPTISERMIENVQKRWIPWYVLKSLEEDRQLLISNRKRVMHLVQLHEGHYKEADLYEWASNLLIYVCNNDVTTHLRFVR